MTQLDLFTDNNAPPDQPGRPAPYPPPELEAPGHRIHPTYYNWKEPHNDPLDQG